MSQPWQSSSRRRVARRTPDHRGEQRQRQQREQREARRAELVAGAVRALGPGADAGRVAELTGLPVGYLRWAYPHLSATA